MGPRRPARQRPLQLPQQRDRLLQELRRQLGHGCAPPPPPPLLLLLLLQSAGGHAPARRPHAAWPGTCACTCSHQPRPALISLPAPDLHPPAPADYGRFFLSWYSGLLIQHADRVLGVARAVLSQRCRPRAMREARELSDGGMLYVFEPAVKLGIKLAGVHW